MVSTFGIHAAGIVISDFPIHDVVPMWKNSKAERITQFDKDEVEDETEEDHSDVEDDDSEEETTEEE